MTGIPLTIAQLVEKGWTEQHLRWMTKQEDSPFFRQKERGGRWLVYEDELEAYVKQARIEKQTEETEKFIRIAQASKIYGIPEDFLREMCNSSRQRFAFRRGKQGNFFINVAKFD